MIITPELIEKAKMAIAEEDVCDPDLCGPDDYCQCRNYARAALTAILPDIVEAIAKVAEYQNMRELDLDQSYGRAMAAKAIRSLADKER